LRKLIALFLTISLVFPLLLGTQAVMSVSSWALDRQFYIDTMNQEQVYSALTSGPLFEKLISSQLNLPATVDTHELERIVQSALSTDYMHSQVDAFIQSLFDYFQGKSDTFSPTLDIAPLKIALEGDQQDAFLTALVAALPNCEPGQNPGFGSENQTACKLSGVSDELLVNQVIKPALPGIIAALPDEIPLDGYLMSFQETSSWRSFIPGIAIPASMILSVLVLVFLAVSAWYITALIADASWHSRLQWLGWMLLVPSALIFFIGFVDQSGILDFWVRFGLERANFSSVPFGDLLGETLQVIAESALPRVTNTFRMVGGICSGLSAALIFWGIVTPKGKPEQIT
jgi:hypothetical protein